MKLLFKKLTCLVFMLSSMPVIQAKVEVERNRSADATNQKLSDLKVAVLESKLLPTPEGIGGELSRFGSAVSVDGDRALVGAPSSASTGAESGSVYVLEYNGFLWQEIDVWQPPQGESVSQYGLSVSLQGDRALIGTGSAVVYVYDFNGKDWVLIQELLADDQFAGEFGYPVSLFGNSALIGAHQDEENGSQSGAVYVFNYNGITWQKIQKLTASDGSVGDFFGFSISLAEDRALIGSFQDDDNGGFSGSAYIFDYDGNIWSQSQKLIASNGSSFDDFGYSVSLSGNRALIGAPNAFNGDGMAYIFDFDGSEWSQTQFLYASGFPNFVNFGSAVSLFEGRALIGSRLDNENGNQSGASYVFDFDGKNWLETQKIITDDGSSGDLFGVTVSLSGNRALIGSTGDDDNAAQSGSAYVFDLNKDGWQQKQKLTGDVGAAFDEFGYSVSLFENRALIGAYLDDDLVQNTGAAYIFELHGNQWILGQKLTTNDVSRYLGRSVSLYEDRALIGAFDIYDQGFAYVFDFNGSTWEQSQKLAAEDGAINDRFGASVSLFNNRALIGAYYDSNENGVAAGSAYVFDFDGSNWELTQKLLTDDGTHSNQFGYAVSLQQDRALIGANLDSAGSAYVFDYIGGDWLQSQKLMANDQEGRDKFGNSVSLFEDRALVGAPDNDENSAVIGSGAAYVFDLDGISWVQSQKLTAEVYTESGDFGGSVHLNHNRILIGSTGDLGNGSRSGSVYAFDYEGTSWAQLLKISPEDGARFDRFGSSVSLFGNRALIGANLDGDHGANSGSSYIYSILPDLIFSSGLEPN